MDAYEYSVGVDDGVEAVGDGDQRGLPETRPHLPWWYPHAGVIGTIASHPSDQHDRCGADRLLYEAVRVMVHRGRRLVCPGLGVCVCVCVCVHAHTRACECGAYTMRMKNHIMLQKVNLILANASIQSHA